MQSSCNHQPDFSRANVANLPARNNSSRNTVIINQEIDLITVFLPLEESSQNSMDMHV